MKRSASLFSSSFFFKGKRPLDGRIRRFLFVEFQVIMVVLFLKIFFSFFRRIVEVRRREYNTLKKVKFCTRFFLYGRRTMLPYKKFCTEFEISRNYNPYMYMYEQQCKKHVRCTKVRKKRGFVHVHVQRLALALVLAIQLITSISVGFSNIYIHIITV